MPEKRPGVKPTEKDVAEIKTVVKQLSKNTKYPEDSDFGNIIMKEAS
jgi:hypothetical protein